MAGTSGLTHPFVFANLPRRPPRLFLAPPDTRTFSP